MEAATFDHLSRRLAVSTSRRGLLKAFVAGAAAALLGSLRASPVPAAEAIGDPYPKSFLRGIGYAEAWPSSAVGGTEYNPSPANAPASGGGTGTCGATKDGTGVQLFFGSDAARRESAPM